MPKDELQRLMKYLRYVGFEGYSNLKDVIKLRFQKDSAFLYHHSLRNIDTREGINKNIQSLEPRPESLQFQCRRVIRLQMSIAADGKSILDGIDDLPLPPILLDYLKLKNAE